jgi:hypothetical protein
MLHLGPWLPADSRLAHRHPYLWILVNHSALFGLLAVAFLLVRLGTREQNFGNRDCLTDGDSM